MFCEIIVASEILDLSLNHCYPGNPKHLKLPLMLLAHRDASNNIIIHLMFSRNTPSPLWKLPSRSPGNLKHVNFLSDTLYPAEISQITHCINVFSRTIPPPFWGSYSHFNIVPTTQSVSNSHPMSLSLWAISNNILHKRVLSDHPSSSLVKLCSLSHVLTPLRYLK